MTGMFRDLKVDMGHVLLLAILLFVVYISVKKVNFSMGVCSCPRASAVREGMSNLSLDCTEMCDQATNRDISGYTAQDYTPLY